MRNFMHQENPLKKCSSYKIFLSGFYCGNLHKKNIFQRINFDLHEIFHELIFNKNKKKCMN